MPITSTDIFWYPECFHVILPGNTCLLTVGINFIRCLECTIHQQWEFDGLLLVMLWCGAGRVDSSVGHFSPNASSFSHAWNDLHNPYLWGWGGDYSCQEMLYQVNILPSPSSMKMSPVKVRSVLWPCHRDPVPRACTYKSKTCPSSGAFLVLLSIFQKHVRRDIISVGHDLPLTGWLAHYITLVCCHGRHFQLSPSSLYISSHFPGIWFRMSNLQQCLP